MKRSGVSLQTIVDLPNLVQAFYLAARGKRQRRDVRDFQADLFTRLATLQRELLDGDYRPGNMSRFHIRDPKPRIIHAPCFRDRVLHHALMAHVGPVLDRALVFDTYACRVGKGTLAAVLRCRQHCRRFPWYVKVDMRAYFASVDHTILKSLLRRRLKNPKVLAFIDLLIGSYSSAPGRGLPIGALTSQHFANFYLSGFDRWLLERDSVLGMVRYMDDVVWWCDSRASAKASLQDAQGFLREALHLKIKPDAQLNRSTRGVTLCGYRVLPGALRLTRRRRERYAVCRRRWERAYARGEIDSLVLQAGYSSALGMTIHADAAAWRREQLQRRPPEPAVEIL